MYCVYIIIHVDALMATVTPTINKDFHGDSMLLGYLRVGSFQYGIGSYWHKYTNYILIWENINH